MRVLATGAAGQFAGLAVPALIIPAFAPDTARTGPLTTDLEA